MINQSVADLYNGQEKLIYNAAQAISRQECAQSEPTQVSPPMVSLQGDRDSIDASDAAGHAPARIIGIPIDPANQAVRKT